MGCGLNLVAWRDTNMFVGAVRGAGVCDVRGLCCWGRGQLVVISREKRGKTRNQRETIFCPEVI